MKNRHRSVFLILCIIILLIYIGAVGYDFISRNNENARNESPLSHAVPEDFRIAGIGLEMPDRQVTVRLGRPLREKADAKPSFQNPSFVVYRTRWFYARLEVWLLSSAAKNASVAPKERRVIKIIASKPGYKTFRGITIGDSMKETIRQYGPAELRNHSLDYVSDLGDISFFITGSRVSRIEIEANID